MTNYNQVIDGYCYGLPDDVSRYVDSYKMRTKSKSTITSDLRLINQFYEKAAVIIGKSKDDISKADLKARITDIVGDYLDAPIKSNRSAVGYREPTQRDINKRLKVIEDYLEFLHIAIE